MFVKEKKKN